MPLVFLYSEELVSHAIAKMTKYGISQIPVLKDNKFVGSIDDSKIYKILVEQPELRDAPISSFMSGPFPVVSEETSIEDLSILITENSAAVLVELADGKFHILTRYDIISAMS